MTAIENNLSPYLTFVLGAAPGTPAAGNVRVFWDVADSKFKMVDSTGAVVAAGGGGSTVAFLDDLTDVLVGTGAAAPASGDFLYFDGVEWTNLGFVLSALGGVSVGSEVNGEVLTFNGSVWTNLPPAASPAQVPGTHSADWTFSLPDQSRLSLSTGVAGSWINANIPTNASVAFPIGTKLDVIRMESTVQFTPISPVVLHAPRGAKTALQYSKMTATKVGTDEWVVSGDTVA